MPVGKDWGLVLLHCGPECWIPGGKCSIMRYGQGAGRSQGMEVLTIPAHPFCYHAKNGWEGTGGQEISSHDEEKLKVMERLSCRRLGTGELGDLLKFPLAAHTYFILVETHAPGLLSSKSHACSESAQSNANQSCIRLKDPGKDIGIFAFLARDPLS